MSFERHLLHGIPQAEAADFFIRVRGKDKLATAADIDAALAALPAEERAALLKEAGAMPGPTMGAAAMGQHAPVQQPMPLAPSASGQIAAPTPKLAAKEEPKKAPLSARVGEHVGRHADTYSAVSGALTGAGVGATAGMALTKKKPLLGAAAGALAGGLLGRTSGRFSQGVAAGMAHAHKHNETSKEGMASDKSPEEVGKERARASVSADFDKRKAHRSEHFHDVTGRLVGAAIGAKTGKSPMGRLGGAALGQHLGGHIGRGVGAAEDMRRHDKHAAAFKIALQQTGIEPELDPQTQQYLQAEEQATILQEQNEVSFLRQKLQETQEAAQQAESQAQQLGEAQANHDAQMQQIQAQVADSTQKAMAAQDQVLQQQQAAAAMRMAYQQLRGTLLEAASTEPPSMTPGAPAPAAAAPTAPSPTGEPEPTQGPTNQAATAPAAAGVPGPEGEAVPQAGAQQGAVGQLEPTGQTGQQDQPKTASLAGYLSAHAGQLAKNLPYAAGGALLGAGIGAGEALTSNAPLREKVKELEGKEGLGYGGAMNLAQTKARLTMGEFAEKHPAASMGAGALAGGMMGLTGGKELVGSLKRSGEHIGGIAKDLKTGLGK